MLVVQFMDDDCFGISIVGATVTLIRNDGLTLWENSFMRRVEALIGTMALKQGHAQTLFRT